ncbi:MAG: glycoside hydrolase domain-containing protein, partial [Bacteroidales bacterium]|nr:glycoside hydrolase domain-containing protein [Bacteroidales bacterium]
MKKLLPALALLLLITSCQNADNDQVVCHVQKDFTQYVNPFIGTSKMGHVFPGAAAPFGMVQLSPQTNFVEMFDEEGRYYAKTYEYCAGYQYTDSIIIGFAHTNFSGTGHSDLGDILVMPITWELWDSEKVKNWTGPSWRPGKDYYSKFSHYNELAEPGYYSVFLDDYGIQAELTTSERVGFHQYTYKEVEDATIILDMIYNVYHHDEKNVWTSIRVENDTLVTGYRQTRGWARDRKVFFAIAFSEPIKEYGHERFDQVIYNGFYRRFKEHMNFPEMAGNDIRAWFNFGRADTKIKMKVALSPVSTAGALNNMLAEIPHWDFDKVRAETHDKWNAELARVDAEFIQEEDYITFYTALYHSFLTP